MNKVKNLKRIAEILDVKETLDGHAHECNEAKTDTRPIIESMNNDTYTAFAYSKEAAEAVLAERIFSSVCVDYDYTPELTQLCTELVVNRDLTVAELKAVEVVTNLCNYAYSHDELESTILRHVVADNDEVREYAFIPVRLVLFLTSACASEVQEFWEEVKECLEMEFRLIHTISTYLDI